MGEVRVEIVAVNPQTGVRSEPIVALADTGATLAVLPGDILDRLATPHLPRRSRASIARSLTTCPSMRGPSLHTLTLLPGWSLQFTATSATR